MHSLIRNRATVVLGRIKGDTMLLHHFKWIRGDIQLFYNVQILIVKPPVLTENQTMSNFTARFPHFEATEYARLLVVLVDQTYNSTGTV